MAEKQTLVLVIDDDAHMRHMVELQMKKTGSHVLVASHGQAGFEQASEHLPDLIVVDYQMPVLDGYQMCVQLREKDETAKIPVIMLTGRGHKLTEEQLSLTNIVRMVSKPFSAKNLLTIAESLLDQSRTCSGVSPEGV